MTPAATERIVIPLSTAQQDVIRSCSGVRKREVILTRLELASLVLAAARAGSDALPVARSAAMRARMLQAESSEDHGGSDVLTLPLTREQRELIRDVTQRAPSFIKLAASEFRVTYRETWSEQATPQLIGSRYLIVADREPSAYPDRDLLIRLPQNGAGSAQQAFGTGAHETTRLPLLLMEEHVRDPELVLDLGTGSGILAVAAARLGARYVLGLDIDADAIATARATVRLNDLDQTIEVRVGDIAAARPPYDLVIANIYANVLIPLAPSLAKAARPNGMVIASGIPAAMATNVLEAFQGAGLVPEAQRRLDTWMAFLFRARP